MCFTHMHDYIPTQNKNMFGSLQKNMVTKFTSRGKEEGRGRGWSLGARVIGSFEPPDVDAEIGTQVLCNSRKWSPASYFWTFCKHKAYIRNMCQIHVDHWISRSQFTRVNGLSKISSWIKNQSIPEALLLILSLLEVTITPNSFLLFMNWTKSYAWFWAIKQKCVSF